MVSVEDSAHRVTQRMDRAEAFLKRRRTHAGGRHHVAARLQVAAVGVGAAQVLVDEAHPLQRDALAHGVVEGRAVGLQAVGQGVHPRARRDRLRHADGELGIGDHHHGQHLGVEDDLLHPRLGVGDDAGAPNLGPGARGGGNGDGGRDGVRIGAGPPVAHVLEVPDRAGLAGHEGDHLAQIQRRAAAEGDDAVMAARAVGGDAGIEVLLGGIGVDLGEDRAAEPALIQNVESPLSHRQRRQAAVGHEERPLDVGVGAGGRQLRDAACAEADGGGIGPVGGKRHGATFSTLGKPGAVDPD